MHQVDIVTRSKAKRKKVRGSFKMKIKMKGRFRLKSLTFGRGKQSPLLARWDDSGSGV